MSSEIKDEKGQWKKGHSGNPNGRPKGSAGKVSANKLANLMSKHGPEAVEVIAKIMNDAMNKETPDVNTALKAGMWVGGKYFEFVLNQQKMELQIEQAKNKSNPKSEDEDESEEDSQVIRPVVFSLKAGGE